MPRLILKQKRQESSPPKTGRAGVCWGRSRLPATVRRGRGSVGLLFVTLLALDRPCAAGKVRSGKHVGRLLDDRGCLILHCLADLHGHAYVAVLNARLDQGRDGYVQARLTSPLADGDCLLDCLPCAVSCGKMSILSSRRGYLTSGLCLTYK